MNDDDTGKAGATMIAREPLERSRPSRMRWAVVGAALLSLQAGTAVAGGQSSLLDRRICERRHLSPETQTWCDSIAGLSGRALYKATVLENLRRTNQPPVAHLQIDRVLPDRVDVNALDSTDEDGFPNIYYFRLEDAATGEVVAGPITTREPAASLRLNGRRPEKIRAFVVVEDDERAIDEASLDVDLPALCGSNANVSCFPQGGAPEITTCTPTLYNFTAFELLDAARRCNANITTSTPVVFSAGGAAGGRGADVWPVNGSPGGAGGLAALGTTLEHLDDEFGSDATYCYGFGNAGGHTDTASGAGGAASILRTCDNVSQTETTGVLLIAGGGGGGRAAGGGSGGDGGVAYSGTDGPCPGSCILSTVPAGQGGGGGTPGNGGGSGNGGGAGSDCQAGGNGSDGIGGAGGYVPGFGTAYWGQGDPQVGGNVGQGGQNCNPGPAAGSTPSGGGGYGGGGGGGQLNGGGGGGGGSFAAQSTLDNIDSSQWSRSQGGGWIYILFKPQS